MSARSVSHKGFGGSHVLPSNPTFLDFPRSDGDQSNWPTNTTYRVDNEGHVNFMREVALDEPLSVKWRIEVGAALAARMNMDPAKTYVLQGWPSGYQMFDHNKGPKDAPRHDAYLIGSTYAKRFRSVPEFIPHALWLLTDPALDRSNCNCKYCNKKPQREITASMGLLPKRGGSTPTSTRSVPAPPRLKRQSHFLKERSPARDKEKPTITREKEEERPFAAVRRAPKVVKQSAPKQSMLRERHADLSCAYGHAVANRRWFREGELLWCALSSPIEGPSGPGGEDSIFFWPGIVEETRVKPIPIPKDAVMDQSSGPSTARPDVTSNSSDRDEVPWTIHHILSYKMKLLGVSHSFYVPDDQVLPYQSIVPPDELIQAIHGVPIEELERDPAHTSTFNPYTDSNDKISFAKAAASYGIALQIAAYIAGYWTPTDDWEFKFTVDHPVAGVSQPSRQPQSLDSVMNSSMAHNAALLTSRATPSGSGSGRPSIPTPPVPPLAQGQTVVQIRYQGLWWGAERIWTDELVRLKFARAQVAPQGNDVIYAPARPSRKAQEYAQVMGSEVGGAETRGVFMHLEGLYVADSPDRRGTKICLAVGIPYELVDVDWEDDDGSEMVVDKGREMSSTNHSANGGGTGSIAEPQPTDTSPPLANADSATPDNSNLKEAPTTAGEPRASSASILPKDNANGALSHPVLSSPFLLPEAPEGFKFRPILKPGFELVVDLTWIAGRYYPGLLRHKLLDRHVERALVSGGMQLWALEGLMPGYYNAMDPVKWRQTRSMMVREADHDARAGLEAHWKSKEKERQDAKVLEKSFLPPVPPPESDGAHGSNDAVEWRASATGLLNDDTTAMLVD